MAPINPVEFLFSVIIVNNILECFFCDEDITPEIDFYAVLTTIPGKKNLMNTHVDCFEQLGWSMTNFVFNHRGKIDVVGAMN